MNRREAKRLAYALAAELLLDNVEALERMAPEDWTSEPADQGRLLGAQLELAEQLAGVVLGRVVTPSRRVEVRGQLQLGAGPE